LYVLEKYLNSSIHVHLGKIRVLTFRYTCENWTWKKVFAATEETGNVERNDDRRERSEHGYCVAKTFPTYIRSNTKTAIPAQVYVYSKILSFEKKRFTIWN
jgi:hypothetical protein